jgi:glycosyltransferase involved in cell wall biosynthesis
LTSLGEVYLKSILSKNQDRELSILFVGTQMATGGAQKVLLDQALWFHERRHKVMALFFYDKEGLHQKWQDISPFPIYNLNAFQDSASAVVKSFYLLSGLWNLWKLMRREKFDVIESFTHDSNIIALPLAWLAGAPIRIASHHGVIDGFPRWREKLHSWIVNVGIADILVAVSTRTQQLAETEGVKPERIAVIPNGITPVDLELVSRSNARKETGVTNGDLYLLSVGRLVYQKGHEFLIHAMPEVLRHYPNTKAGICGDGVLRSQLEEQILKLDLSDSVKLLGQWDNVSRFLAIADVFILPSRWEGLPIALLEAMSAGLPVIATRVEGVEEVVEDQIHGLLVPLEDSEALAKAILQLINDPKKRNEMGMAASLRVKQLYTADRMCEEYLKLIKKLSSLKTPLAKT